MCRPSFQLVAEHARLSRRPQREDPSDFDVKDETFHNFYCRSIFSCSLAKLIGECGTTAYMVITESNK